MFEIKNRGGESKISLFLLLIIISSYVLGFYLNEDSAGGGKLDYIDHEWGTIQLFAKNSLSEVLDSMSYESSRTPLFYILNKYNPLANEIEQLRLSCFLFSAIIPFFLYSALKFNFPKEYNKNYIFIFSFIIFLSPYFRTNAYWPSSENLQIIFVILSIIFYLKLINTVRENKHNLYYLSSLSALFAFCAFYTDQKAFFLAALIYFDLIRRNNFSFFVNFSLINFIFFLPTIYLFYKWGGIVPIGSQFRVSSYLNGTNIFLSTIGIYFGLIFISNIFNDNFRKKINIEKIDIILIACLSIFIFFTLPSYPITFGSGIVSKLLGVITVKLNYDWKIIKLVYFLINFSFIIVLILLLEKSLRNIVVLLSFLLVYNLTPFSYQSYVDPIFYILILTIFDFKKEVKIFNNKILYLFLIFYTAMLSGSIIMRNFII